MYNQPEAILENYNIEIDKISKGRGAYVCESDRGRLLLVPFRGSARRALFLKEVLEELVRFGYPAEQVILTKEGEPLAESETGERFWLKSTVSGAECSTGRETDMLLAVEQLAKLHNASEQCTLSIPDFMMSDRSNPRILFEKHYRELIKVKNYVRTRKTKNEFERSFQEQYPHYIADAERTLEMLDGQGQEGRYLLCHGDFNQHNVLRTPDGFRIVHFENMCYNPAMSDLANFVRKMLEKNNWNRELGMGLIREYERTRPLEKTERSLLYVLLLFPEKLWKISNHYANSHKAWVSGRDIEKLEFLIAQEKERHLFLENLFSII